MFYLAQHVSNTGIHFNGTIAVFFGGIIVGMFIGHWLHDPKKFRR